LVWLAVRQDVIFYSGGVQCISYALMLASAIAAFLIGIVAAALLAKVTMPMEYRAVIMVI